MLESRRQILGNCFSSGHGALPQPFGGIAGGGGGRARPDSHELAEGDPNRPPGPTPHSDAKAGHSSRGGALAWTLLLLVCKS